MARLAGFPAIKTVDGFDFEFAVGVQLASLTFILMSAAFGARDLHATEWNFCNARLVVV